MIFKDLETDIIDKGLNNGVPAAMTGLHNRVKKLQSGVLSHNIMYMVIIFVILIIGFVVMKKGSGKKREYRLYDENCKLKTLATVSFENNEKKEKVAVELDILDKRGTYAFIRQNSNSSDGVTNYLPGKFTIDPSARVFNRYWESYFGGTLKCNTQMSSPWYTSTPDMMSITDSQDDVVAKIKGDFS